MRMVDLHEQERRAAFAKRAAKKFADNPNIYTYSDESPAEDQLFAVRWGLHDRAVLVFEIKDTPEIYQDLVPINVIQPKEK